MSNKSRIIKIVTLLIIFVILFMNVTNAQTMRQLREKTENDKWFSDNSLTGLPKSKSQITWAQDGEGFRADLRGSYCIDEPTSNNPKFTAPKTVNTVIDINNDEVANGEGKVIVYTKSGTYTYNVSDANQNDVNGEGKGIYEALRLANLAKVATERGEQGVNIFQGGTNGSAKFAMAVMFGTDHVLSSLRKIHIGEKMSTSGKYTYSYDRYGNYVGNALANTDLNNAAYEASSVISSIKDKTLNKENVKVEIINGKTYIGPYKVAYSGGSISQISIVTEKDTIKADAITYDKKESKKISELENNKEFYIVAGKEITNTIKDITISVKGVKSSKARIVILDGKSGQDFIVYRGKSDNNSTELHLPTPKAGTLEIQKVDQFKDSKVSLKDIEFKVYAEKKGWVNATGEKIEFVSKFDDAKAFKTDKNGKITIKNLPTGKYSIYETGLPNNLQEIYELGEIKVPGKDEKVKAKRVTQGKNGQYYTVSAGQTATVTAVNDRARTDVYVHKTDADTGKALNGYEFRLYRIDGDKQGWVKAENNTVLEKDMYTTDFDDAKVAKLVTVNGKTPTLQGLPVGKYELYETKLGENSEAYDLGTFAKDGNKHPGKLVDTQEVKANTTGVFTFEVKNRQVFIKITGKVFEDIFKLVKNEPERDGVYNSVDDKLIEGIEVTLVDRITKQEISTFTNAKGEYTFDKVRIRASDDSETADYLNRYYVKFKYDGFIYQSMLSSINEVKRFNDDGTINTTTSKAFETETTRGDLDKLFQNVTGDGQKLSNGVELKYNKAESGLVTLDNTSKLVETNTGIKVEGKTDFEVKATVVGNLLQAYYDKLKETQDVVTEIPHIDLGVYRRNMTDLSLTKNVHSAEVNVNKQTYTYRYDRTGDTETSVGVEFDGKYSLPLYKADVEFDPDDKNLALHAAVIYRIQLTNHAGELYSTINGLDEWYSKNYSVAKENGEYAIYLSDDANGYDKNNRVRGVKIETDTSTAKSASTYTKSRITFGEPIRIPARLSNESNIKYLYIKFDINDIKDIYNKEANLENYAEINSYTVYQDAQYTKPYAAIDNNSVPRTLNPKNFDETDEDDSDKAKGLHLIEAAERTISGTVFEDEAVSFGAGKERKGNGIFDETKENTISGVKVQLKDDKGNIAKVYNGTEMVDAPVVTTDENGNFKVSGLVAGIYKLEYTWGDDKYKVENYKGTIYVTDGRAEKWIEQEDPRYSDAIDDYNLRIAIDQKALYNKDTAGYDDLSKMISETPLFAIGIEKKKHPDAPGENGFEYNIANVDFGIIERPRQAMEINKNLKSILLTTGQGDQIVNASIKEDGTLDVKTGEKWVTGGKDYLWVQVDKSITQELKAEMGYNITVSNVSEIDYDNEDYYKYGIKNGDQSIINLRAEAVYDYCKGAEISSDATAWETVKSGEYKIQKVIGDTIVDVDTMTEENFKEQYDRNKEEHETVEDFTWESAHSEIKDIYTEWSEQLAATGSDKEKVRYKKLDDREILKYNGTDLTRKMKPGDSETAVIKISKKLANGADIRFDNDAEITNIIFEAETALKTGSKPNAYTSKAYTRAAWTTVTPATGEDRDYTWIIITAVSAIAVLGVGIIIIKKKVLK